MTQDELAECQRQSRARAIAKRLSERDRVLFMLGLHISQVTAVSSLACVSMRLAGDTTHFQVDAVRRFPVGTSYGVIFHDTKKVLDAVRQPVEMKGLAVDLTVTGRSMGELLSKTGLRYVPYTIEDCGSSGASKVSLRDLVTKLQTMIQTGRFRIRADMPDLDGLLHELKTFEVSIDASGHSAFKSGATTPARVLAIGLAVWDLWFHELVLWPELSRRAEFAEGS